MQRFPVMATETSDVKGTDASQAAGAGSGGATSVGGPSRAGVGGVLEVGESPVTRPGSSATGSGAADKAGTTGPPAGPWKSLALAMKSWRTASVVLMSLSCGLPLGLVWNAIPDWMRSSGMDIRVVGVATLAQAPWAFKFLWSPLMDRWAPSFMGRRRGWAFLAQTGLVLGTLGLATVGQRPEVAWPLIAFSFVVAFAAATQDIAVDAYAVDVLRREEQGAAVGARVALYRGGMFLAGALAITLAGWMSWPVVFVLLAALYLPLMVVTARAPEPEAPTAPPRTLKEAVWHPFLGFLARHRALEILAFVVLYKLTDNLGGALVRPFLNDMGYDAVDRGAALGTVGLTATILGTLVGGFLTTLIGLGHSLWLCGGLQILSNLGYVAVAANEVNRPLMYGAMGFESLTQGLGTGAYSVLLMRLTQKRFSATQFALFSSLFAVPRLLAGPVAGVTVDAMGWGAFFWISMVAGIPGMLLLGRFVPLGVREPELDEGAAPAPGRRGRPVGTPGLVLRGIVGAGVALAVCVPWLALLDALKARRAAPGSALDFSAAIAGLLNPASPSAWVKVVSVAVFAGLVGLFTAAVFAARSGASTLPPETSTGTA